MDEYESGEEYDPIKFGLWKFNSVYERPKLENIFMKYQDLLLLRKNYPRLLS